MSSGTRYDPSSVSGMMLVLRPLVLTGLFMAAGCGPPSPAASGAGGTPPSAALRESERAPVAISTPMATAPAIESEREPESWESYAGRTLPLFVEITQTASLSRAWYPSPPVQVGAGAFFFQADTRTLHVEAAHAASPVAADVLIGLISILEVPGQTFENRELFQYPGAQPDSFHIVSLETETGRVELRYLGQLHVLAPGESLTFKEPGAGSDSRSTVTTIVSHGRLDAFQTFTADGVVP